MYKFTTILMRSFVHPILMMKIIKASLLALSLVLCSFPIFAKEKVLQSIDNLDNEEVHTDEGNYFKLIRIDQGCRIEAGFYLSYKHEIYNYYFNTQTIYKATRKTFKYHYRKDEEGSLGAVTGIYQDSSEVYALSNPDMLKRYQYFKSLFPNTSLKQCI